MTFKEVVSKDNISMKKGNEKTVVEKGTEDPNLPPIGNYEDPSPGSMKGKGNKKSEGGGVKKEPTVRDSM